ncbi:MAG: hypothetical protein AAGC96_08750 [Pseudomonadota bacterium]
MIRIALLILVGFGVSACQTGPTVVDPLIGKQLVTEGGSTLLLRRNGTIGGQAQGEQIVGTYSADSTEICSTLTEPAGFAGERCSVPVIRDNTVVFNRRDGSSSPVYNIGG